MYSKFDHIIKKDNNKLNSISNKLREHFRDLLAERQAFIQTMNVWFTIIYSVALVYKKMTE